MDQLLFVYGTLKRGQKANHLLGRGRFERAASTLPRYRLLNLGDHPGLIEVDGAGVSVKGELWRIDPAAFAELDAYEGPDYGRRPIAIEDCAEKVITYFFLGDRSSLPECGAEWQPRPGSTDVTAH
jgi:gamma-glutamylcyclotransferase (GGCT)/AIG2-like uncharacterized protein YtfP